MFVAVDEIRNIDRVQFSLRSSIPDTDSLSLARYLFSLYVSMATGEILPLVSRQPLDS